MWSDGSPLIISFQGVESGLLRWCNGHYAGYSEDAFAPSEFDLTPYLTEGENKLAGACLRADIFKHAGQPGLLPLLRYFSAMYISYTVPAGASSMICGSRPELDESLETGRLEIEAQIRISKTNTEPEKSRNQRLRLYYAPTRGEEQVLRARRQLLDGFFRFFEIFQSGHFRTARLPRHLERGGPRLYDLTLRLVCEKREEKEETERKKEKN